MNTKRLLSTLMVLLVTASLLLAACAPTVSVTDSKDPVTVVKNFYEVLNTKDVEKAMSLTAEDYVMNDPFGTYDRPAAAVQWQSVVDAGLTFNQTNFVDTGGGRVTSCYEVFENGKSIDKGCGNVTHVRDGKIIFDGLLSAENIWIVQRYYDALNVGNIDQAMTFAVDDIVTTDATNIFSGKQKVTETIKSFATAGFTYELSELSESEGRVTSCYKVFKAGASVDQGCGNVTIIRDGKILFDGVGSLEAKYVIQKYYDELNARDLDLATSFIARDAVFINPTGSYEGLEAIRASLEGLASDNITFKLSKLRGLNGRIIYDYEVLQGDTLLDQGTNGLTIVKDGKIIFDGTEDTGPAQ